VRADLAQGNMGIQHVIRAIAEWTRARACGAIFLNWYG